MVGIILFGTSLMTLLIMQATNSGIEKNTRGTRFGIYLPSERMNDERVLEVVKDYKKENKWWFYLSFLTLFTMLIKTSYFSIIFSLFMVWTIVLIVAKFGLINRAAKALKRLKYENHWTDEARDAEEKHWIFGLFYCNPESTKFWVNQTNGLGTTVNIATKSGKRLIIATVAIILVTLVPTWGLILVDDFVAPSISLTEERLVIKSAMNKSEVDYEDILDIRLVYELEEGAKVNGSATPLYSRGHFYLSSYGDCELSVFRGVKPIIVIITKDREESEKMPRPVIFNTKTAEATLDIYQELQDRIGN